MRLLPFLFLASNLYAEVVPISLKQALERALRANPDVLLARVEEQKAQLAIRIAKDPFRPKVFVGSGLAYTTGFPMSIEGSAPSVLQARAVSSVINRPFTHQIAQVQEQARTAAIDTEIKRDQVVLETAELFYEAARWAQTADAIRPQIAALERGAETVRFRVKEGRELEIEARRADLAVARTRHRLAQIEQEQVAAEATLAIVLGYSPEDRLRPTDLKPLPAADAQDAVVRRAVDESREVRRLESALLAKRHQLRSFRAARLPVFDLVAQYGLFTKFNNYEDYFRTFSRHNGQLGVSIQLPLVPSAASAAQSGQAEAEISGLQTQIDRTRSRIVVNTRNTHRQVELAETTRDLARQDLEIARDQVNILLALLEEGRATLRQLEDARFAEQERWIVWHDAQTAVEKAKIRLLSATGQLRTALQ
ncbi:MAG: TolC family protein [Bryobacterales bacterium]|nr:TolC family protein [Bryobacterales bacterium]